MKVALTALRSVCLTVALLTTVAGSATAQCPAPITGGVQNFGAQPIGTMSAPRSVFGCAGACPGTSFTIVGPNAAEFAVQVTGCTGGVSCSATATFTPAACGPRVAFLVATLTTPANINGVLFPAGCVSDIIPLVGTGVGAPVAGPTLTFPSACAGTLGASVTLTLPANTTPSIVGPGNFSITATDCPQPATTCTVTIRFNPLAAACGTVTSTLQVTSTLTNCVLATFELSGFACSFTCAIGLTGSDSVFSAAGRKCVIESLQIAAASTGLTRCAALRCAECCAEAELATKPAGSIARASVQALLDQIRCLQACFGCAPFPC